MPGEAEQLAVGTVLPCALGLADMLATVSLVWAGDVLGMPSVLTEADAVALTARGEAAGELSAEALPAAVGSQAAAVVPKAL